MRSLPLKFRHLTTRTILAILLLLGTGFPAALCAPPAEGFDPHAKPLNIFTPERLMLTAEYAREHYGLDSAELAAPRMVVLHYTAFHTMQESYRFFLPALLDTKERADITSGGRVNVSAHYLVDRDGTVYQLASEKIICRHIIGFNHTAIGIENVGKNESEMTEAQAKSNALLVSRILQRHPGIEYLIGHQEYQNRRLPHFKLFLEKDPSYGFTTKHDPGNWFLKRVRTLLKTCYHIVLKD